MTLQIPSLGDLRVLGRTRGVVTALATRGAVDVLVRVIEVRPSDDQWPAVRQALVPPPTLLDHPAVVGVEDAGRLPDGRVWLLLDAAHGDHLAHQIGIDGRLEPDVALRHAVDVAGALATAHNLGLVHGGVAPDRLLTLQSGRVRLADFGVARIVSDTRLGGRSDHLDPAHLAPEVLEHAPVTAGTDVHALASTMVALVTGRPPAALTDHDPEPVLIMRKLAGEVAHLPGRVPAALARLIRETVLAPAHDRPSMASFAHALADQAERMGLEGIEPRIDRPTSAPPPDRAPVDPTRPVITAAPIWSDSDPASPSTQPAPPEFAAPESRAPAATTPVSPSAPTSKPPTLMPPSESAAPPSVSPVDPDVLPTGGFWNPIEPTPRSSTRPIVGGLVALTLLVLVVWTLLS